MAAKAPFWEIKKSHRKGYLIGTKQPFWAHLKGKNGRVVSHTENYATKQGVHKALEVANPNGIYEVRDTTV